MFPSILPSKISPRPSYLTLIKRSRSHGFTLIEIIVVVMILGLLAAMIVPKVLGRADDARIQTALQNIASISQSLRLYRLDNFSYPTTEQGLNALVKQPTLEPIPRNYRSEGYMDKVPQDPWGRPFVYLIPGKHGEFDLYSLGPDGNPDEPNVKTGDDVAPWKIK